VLQSAIDHATRALGRSANGSDSAAALEALGSLRLAMARYEERERAALLLEDAETDLRSAVRLDEARPKAWEALSRLAEHRGDDAQAYEYAAKAYEFDSFLEIADVALARLVYTSLDLRRIDQAFHWWRELQEVNPGDQGVHMTHLYILASLEDPGLDRVDEALASTDSVAELGIAERRDAWRAWGHMLTAIVLASAGRPDSAKVLIAGARPVMEADTKSMRDQALYLEAVALARSGDAAGAIALLRRYIEAVPSGAQRLGSDPWLEVLWGDPQFRALYETPTEAVTGY
jgi:tetratricopeptide (TPR) repeat protein